MSIIFEYLQQWLYWVLQVIYLITPAIAANMAPPMKFVRTFPGGIPIWQEKLGSNKTYRGLVAAILAAMIACCIQWLLYTMFDDIRSFSLSGNPNPFYAGFMWGFGALFGDAAESYIMRQNGVAPGVARISDRFDYIIGSLAFVAIFVTPVGFREVLLAIVLGIIFHPLVKRAGFILKLTKDGVDAVKRSNPTTS